jgi:hypothetical protein
MADDNLKYDLTLDEIVFENRNKEYGAYDLRLLILSCLQGLFNWDSFLSSFGSFSADLP